MKKILIIILVMLVTGCSDKADILCTNKGELFTTEVGLYFKGNTLTDAYSISTYEDEGIAKQVCETLGNKVKCYQNNIEIVSFYDSYKNLTKYSIITNLEDQGFTCK